MSIPRVNKSAEKMKRKKPEQTSGRHAYIRSLHEHARETLAAGESGTGFIKLVPQGLVQGDTFELTIEVTADGLLAPQTVTFSLGNAEVDVQNVASETFTFETDVVRMELYSRQRAQR